AGEDAAVIAPAGVRRGAAAAGVGRVDDVVVDERGAVEEFDDGGKSNGAAAGVACVTCGKEEQSGTQALAAATEKIAGDFGNRRKGGGALSRQFLFDQHEVVPDEIKDLPNCQQRDGLPPDLRRTRACVERNSIAFERMAVKRACVGCGSASRRRIAAIHGHGLVAALQARSTSEKTAEICGGRGGDFFCGQVSHSGDGLCYFGEVGGLVALAAEALRREKW